MGLRHALPDRLADSRPTLGSLARGSFLAQYYEPNYREIGVWWETGSTSSTGSGGSGSHTSIPESRLTERTAETVYWA